MWILPKMWILRKGEIGNWRWKYPIKDGIMWINTKRTGYLEQETLQIKLIMDSKALFSIPQFNIHMGQTCFVWVACHEVKCLCSIGREWGREGGPLPLAFQYFVLLIWRPCDLNLVMLSSALASKGHDFTLTGLQFHFIKWLKNGHPNFKGLPFWSFEASEDMYHDQI